MKIYKLFDNAAQYSSFHLDLEEYLDLLDPHIGEQAAMQLSQTNTAVANYWQSLPVSIKENKDSKNRMPDLGIWRGATLFLSPKALVCLKPLLADVGEFLPLNMNAAQYTLFNCLTQVDADPDKSARTEENGFFMDVEKLVFPTDISFPLFKSPYENNRNLFCTERFKLAIEEDRLGGIYFSEDLVDFN